MSDIILHIGSEKTGSTALQHFLSKNHKQLSRGGFYYPCARDELIYSSGRRGHFPLVASFFLDLPDFVSRKEHYDNGTMMSQLRRIAESEDRRIILSCEHFSSRLSSHHIDVLADALSSHNVRVLFYMRPQQDLFWSSYSTAVINGRRERLNYGSLSTDDPYLNYYKLLEPWANSFGSENIIVRNYSNLLKGDIVDDFMSSIGIDDISLYTRQGSRNRAMSPEEVEFIRLINAYLPSYEEAGGFWHSYFVLFRRYIRHASILLGKDKALKSKIERGEAFDIFIESNSKTINKYKSSLFDSF